MVIFHSYVNIPEGTPPKKRKKTTHPMVDGHSLPCGSTDGSHLVGLELGGGARNSRSLPKRRRRVDRSPRNESECLSLMFMYICIYTDIYIYVCVCVCVHLSLYLDLDIIYIYILYLNVYIINNNNNKNNTFTISIIMTIIVLDQDHQFDKSNCIINHIYIFKYQCPIQ